MGTALFAPIGVLMPKSNDLLFEHWIVPVGLFGCGTGELLQHRIAAGFPIVEDGVANMGDVTGHGDIATRLF